MRAVGRSSPAEIRSLSTLGPWASSAWPKRGYQDGIRGINPYKGRGKPRSQKNDANRSRVRLRAPGERANAQFKAWRILRKLRRCPAPARQLDKAIHALQIQAAKARLKMLKTC